MDAGLHRHAGPAPGRPHHHLVHKFVHQKEAAPRSRHRIGKLCHRRTVVESPSRILDLEMKGATLNIARDPQWSTRGAVADRVPHCFIESEQDVEALISGQGLLGQVIGNESARLRKAVLMILQNKLRHFLPLVISGYPARLTDLAYPT